MFCREDGRLEHFFALGAPGSAWERLGAGRRRTHVYNLCIGWALPLGAWKEDSMKILAETVEMPCGH